MTAEGVPAAGRPAWRLSAAAFERLLAFLGGGGGEAGQRYEAVRAKLLRLFGWRGCDRPEELADETLDRVARRLEEGVEPQVSDPYRYVHGVALRVAQEHWKRTARAPQVLEHVTHLRGAFAPPSDAAETAAARERRLDCLAGCLARLAPDAQRLLEAYHLDGEGARARARERLAHELGIGVNALRIRVHRLRAGLAGCIEGCEARAERPDETNGPSAHEAGEGR